jgi:methionyl-tRNA formyltransferase
MRVAIIGQQDFGKATLDAFLARGDQVTAVFCAPDTGRCVWQAKPPASSLTSSPS